MKSKTKAPTIAELLDTRLKELALYPTSPLLREIAIEAIEEEMWGAIRRLFKDQQAFLAVGTKGVTRRQVEASEGGKKAPAGAPTALTK